MHYGKTADRIRTLFGMVGRTGPGMRQVVGFGDPSTERGNFGGKHGAPLETNGTLRRTCVKVRDPSELRVGVPSGID